jgi:hypothetical protein
MGKKTVEEAERVGPRLEEERQRLQESEENDQPAGEQGLQVRMEPYFPEVFLG